MSRVRIVVTGLGLVSCFGSSVRFFYDQLLAGVSGVSSLVGFDSYPVRFAAAVRDCDGEGYIDKKPLRRIDPFIKYGMVAGKRAVEDAKIGSSLDKRRSGVLIGSGMGGMRVFSDGVQALLEKGHNHITPFFVPYIITNMAGAMLAIDLGFRGPNYSISAACATGSFSIHAAAAHIRSGDADLMVCGGVEAALTPMGVASFAAINGLSRRNDAPQKASRPWDKGRDGFVLGEGSAVLVLERLEHALARDVPIYAEYLGGAVNCDAYHITHPDPDGEGIRQCMESAIVDASIDKEQVNYINAHATSTEVGDLYEIRAIKEVFNHSLSGTSINATKSMIGHSLGAAGGMGAIVAIKAIETGLLHPTINVEDPDEEIRGLDCLLERAREKRISAALVNSFGFGGHNSSLIFAPYHR